MWVSTVALTSALALAVYIYRKRVKKQKEKDPELIEYSQMDKGEALDILWLKEGSDEAKIKIVSILCCHCAYERSCAMYADMRNTKPCSLALSRRGPDDLQPDFHISSKILKNA